MILRRGAGLLLSSRLLALWRADRFDLNAGLLAAWASSSQTLQCAPLFYAALKEFFGSARNNCSQWRVLSSERIGEREARL